ncbi:hypothetical protein [Maridesulfovibrio bastinii]|uniref:hypothetical protein n=1 Tax=Maridesulfovibrio bastinii TaxID=47157 RepID=UPI00041E2375|nr:hypothetical protein [Maridesulfovibrio bastinii]
MDNKVVDLKHITCGLVPAIVDNLKAYSGDVIDFKIRSGIRQTIISGFGTGGQWKMEFITSLEYDTLRLTRVKNKKKVELDIVSY